MEEFVAMVEKIVIKAVAGMVLLTPALDLDRTFIFSSSLTISGPSPGFILEYLKFFWLPQKAP